LSFKINRFEGGTPNRLYTQVKVPLQTQTPHQTSKTWTWTSTSILTQKGNFPT